MANTAPSEVQITAEDVRDSIIKKAGTGITITTKMVSWFPMRDAVSGMALLSGCPENERQGVFSTMKPTLIHTGKPCPFNRKAIVFGIFEDDDIRVYCMGPSDDDASMVLSRYRLSKTSAIFSVDEMYPHTFVDEMTDEFVQLRDGISSVEKERASVLEYMQSLKTDYPILELIEDIKDGVHLEEPDEEEDDEPTEENTAPEPSPSATVTSAVQPVTTS